ncbi:hypothetical protein OGAPHI_004309 [Ogataea philodendri]|uniref:t-SNARE coiled-coil homology domain-containing protein n=1 Tax=Ogataea philodendri TaxID=1378263 RepID=A0A9P8P6G3_9ASCO|nr:uncharacterized protein OGAPHI_004309 [Ogataea philodendri]KAH3666120.1 hypothetical protein OGAPHI_004309 [Ogataea philodendri]
MGIRNMFKPPKEMSKSDVKEYLQDNGVRVKDDDNPHRRKYRFGEFSKYAQAETNERPILMPRIHQDPSSQISSAGSSEDPYNPATQSTVSNVTGDLAGQSHESERYNGAPSYHTYDPYDIQSTSGNEQNLHSQQHQQLQQLQQVPTSDLVTETQTQEDDFDPNSYPEGATSTYDPYLESHVQQQEEEIDEEEEEINRIRRQTKDVREATVKSTHNILGHLRQADDTAANTLGAVGAQREKMFEMERSLNSMDTHQRFVDEHVKQLEHYNRGLFHIKASNPFTKKSRMRAAEQKFLAQRQADRERDATLSSNLYHTQNEIVDQLRDSSDPVINSELKEKYEHERRVKEASKYLGEEHDEEDEKMEVEYSKNVDEAQKLATNLRRKANLLSQEIVMQNKNLKDISEKVNKVDDKLVLTTNRIRGI